MDVAALQKMIESGHDSPMLRLSLALALQKQGEDETALEHLREAVRQGPGYTAAWKALGRALAARGQHDDAREAYQRGIAAAREHGDKQAEREMQVFLKRLEKSAPS